MALNSKTPSYLQPTASTAQRAASSGASRRRPPARHLSPQSRALLPPAKVSQPTLDDESSSKASVSKSHAMGAPTAQPSRSIHAEAPPAPPESSFDTLQVAAQVQSWLFMRSNLQGSLIIVQKGAQDSHNILSEAISNDTCLESGTSRLDAEKLVTFLDELANATPNDHATLFIRRFLEHETSWLELQSELMQFFARLSQAPTGSPLEEGQSLKAHLSEEASTIETLLTEAELWRNEPDRVLHTLAQLYPILQARSDNASVAIAAIDCSLDNIRAMRHLRA